MPNDYDLVTAVEHDEIEAARRLVASGASLKVKDFNNRGLLEVAQNRASHECARFLLYAGMDAEEPLGKSQDTLLHKCARKGDIGMTAILLEAGANPNAPNKYGRLPLEIADKLKHQYLGDLLRSYGARVRTHAEIALGSRELTTEGASR